MSQKVEVSEIDFRASIRPPNVGEIRRARAYGIMKVFSVNNLCMLHGVEGPENGSTFLLHLQIKN